MSKLQELDNKYVANTYARFPVEIVSGKGSINWRSCSARRQA